MLQQIQHLLQNGRHADALQLVGSACAANPGSVDLWLLRASLQAQLNDLGGVVESCGRALALQPQHSAARYNLAVALQALQRNAEAMEHYRALLAQEPANVAALNNLGALLLDADQPAAALDTLQRAIAQAPGFAAAHNTLGLAYDRLDRHAEAQAHFRTAATLDSNLPAARCNLVRSLHRQGETRQAQAELDSLLMQYPNLADARLLEIRLLREAGQSDAARQRLNAFARQTGLSAATHYDVAVEFNTQGDADAAMRHYEAAIALQPNHARALNNLGSLQHRLKRTQQALPLLERAAAAAPQLVEVQVNLSALHWELGHAEAALRHALEAVRLGPGRRDILQRFALILGSSPQFQTTPQLYAAMDACLNDPGVDQQYLVPPGLAIALAEPRIASLIAACQQDGAPAWDAFPVLIDSDAGHLFARLLQNTVLADPAVERTLRTARRAALLAFTDDDGRTARAASPIGIRLLAVLGHQCLNNEFAYAITETEQARLAQLAQTAHATPDDMLTQALLLALYLPLLSVQSHAVLERALRGCGDSAARGLVSRHFDNPRTEAGLRSGIPALTPIDDATSQAVRDQYEASPYPRWLSANIQDSRPYPAPLLDAFAHFTPPDFGTPEIRLLVAGCGTGKHVVQSATRFRGCQATAVDLSRSSLAYGLRMSRELGIDNVEFYCGDILELHALNKTFHIIESVGVLHHLREPEAGLRSLRALLAPHGLMNLGFYSTLARHAVYAAREHFRVAGGWSDLDAIRRARAEILDTPPGHPLHPLLGMQDFYSLSDCRDLLFHTQEHSYRLGELRAMLDRAGLRFIGFEFPDPQIKAHYLREHPEDPTATDLNAWDRYEQRHPDTFVGMYAFWCQAIESQA